MANKIPVKAIYTDSNVTSLGEYISGDTISTTYTDAKVVSVAGVQGNVSNAQLYDGILATGQLTSANVNEQTNLYFTNTRAVDALTNSDVITKNLTVTGNLKVEGNTTILNVETVTVEDKNILLANGSASAAASDGAGITVDGSFASIAYRNTGNKWAFDRNIDVNGSVTATGWSGIYTANVIESTSLYYTDERVYANVNLIGFSSNSYVNTRLSTKANTSDLTTANVTEVTNLYFTNARSRESITVVGAATYDNTTGVISVSGNVSSVAGQVGDISNAQLTAAVKESILGSTGNVIPALDNTYSLGNVTNRFKDLYLAGNTLYLGNLVLKDNGETLEIYDDSNLVFTATATAGFINSTITTFPGSAGDFDYGSGESFVGQSAVISDAFGVSLGTVFDCMEPKGKIDQFDFAVLT